MTEETKKYKTDERKPSELFMDALDGGYGSDDMVCDWCRRLHLCPDNEYVERNDMDREQYRQYCMTEKENNPEGVILHYDCDSVMGHTINGIKFVDGCDCNGLSRYEDFIWRERNIIRSYLKKRIELEYNLAEQELTKNKLAGIDKKPGPYYF